MTNRRILFVTTSMALGGAETQVKILAEGLAQRGWNVKIVSLLPPSAYVEELARQGISVESLGMQRGVPSLGAVRHFRKLVKDWKPSIVHSQMYHANIFSRIALAFKRNCALVCSAQNTHEAPTNSTILRERSARELFYRVTDRLCDITTQICRAGLERYVRVGATPRNRIICIYNGIDTKRFVKDPEVRTSMRKQLGVTSHFLWLAVGRMEPQKDYGNLLAAFRTLLERDADNELVIVGDGQDRAMVESTISALDLSKNVHLLGRRRDISCLMSASDAFVMSSYYEGLPLVLLEAQSTGLPAVTTDVGGTSEIVSVNETGFLCPPKNSELLCASMLQLKRQSPDRLQEMATLARKRVERYFDLHQILGEWERLYSHLTEKP